jgi:hypothetical protein
MECQHFVDCIEQGTAPETDGRQGLELVQILEAASRSLKANGAPVTFSQSRNVLSFAEPEAREFAPASVSA